MLITEIYKGQGLGNQLFCYVTTRVIALDRGYDFGIMHPENFKCLDFMNLDFGRKVIGGKGPEGGPATKLPHGISHYYNEKGMFHINGSDIRTFDINLTKVPDNTKIDGLMQDEEYISHRKSEIRNWLNIKDVYKTEEYSKDNICIINFRGGEYVRFEELFLKQKYWDDATNIMRGINPEMKFVVVTDDTKTARKFFPDFEITHKSIGSDYSIINNAHYIILSNSSFAFFPTWLNEKVKKVIAPKYWARHNISDGYWSCGYNIVNGWSYLDKNGIIYDSESCKEEFKKYLITNNHHTSNEITTGEIYDLKSYKSSFNIFTILYSKISRSLSQNTKNNIKSLVDYLKSIIRTALDLLRKKSEGQIKKLWLNKEEIAKYRKNIRIYDIFTYNGELDILEIRLNILNEFVDEFIIVEAPTTFSGLKKTLYFELHKERFVPFLHKIKYYVIDDYPNDKEICNLADNNSNVPKNGPEHWRREFYQKESIKKALTHLSNDDICYIGDVDEIWNPETVIDYSKDNIFKLKQIVYSYFLNNRSSEPWAGTIVTKYKNIKDKCLNDIRTESKTDYVYLSNGGWHFTSIGGLDEVRRKLNDSYTEKSYNTPEVQENLEKRFGERDYLGRNFKFHINELELPKYLIQNKEKYKNLFK